MAKKRILEVHDTELGPIFLEREANLREKMSWWVETFAELLSRAWYWFTHLITEVDDVRD